MPVLIYLMTNDPPRRLEQSGPRRGPRNERLNEDGDTSDDEAHDRDPEEWLAARLELLEAEKSSFTAATSWQAAQELPWVRSTRVSIRNRRGERLAGRFSSEGRSAAPRLPSCSGPTHGGVSVLARRSRMGSTVSVVSLANHDVTLSAVSRAPLAKLQAYKRRLGWTFPGRPRWAATSTSTSNVGFTEEQRREGGIEYNYRREAAIREPLRREDRSSVAVARGDQGPVAGDCGATGTDVATYTRERRA